MAFTFSAYVLTSGKALQVKNRYYQLSAAMHWYRNTKKCLKVTDYPFPNYTPLVCPLMLFCGIPPAQDFSSWTIFPVVVTTLTKSALFGIVHQNAYLTDSLRCCILVPYLVGQEIC